MNWTSHEKTVIIKKPDTSSPTADNEQVQDLEQTVSNFTKFTCIMFIAVFILVIVVSLRLEPLESKIRELEKSNQQLKIENALYKDALSSLKE